MDFGSGVGLRAVRGRFGGVQAANSVARMPATNLAFEASTAPTLLLTGALGLRTRAVHLK